jgi:hypothetical protein
MCFLFLLLFCIIKLKCFFFTFIFLFIWMQVWSLEKEDTPHSFSSRVFLHYYKFLKKNLLFIWFFHFCKFFLKKLFYCTSLSLFHLFPFLFYSFHVFACFFNVFFMFLFFLFLFCLSSFFFYFYLFIYLVSSGYPWPSDTVKSPVSLNLIHVLIFFFKIYLVMDATTS